MILCENRIKSFICKSWQDSACNQSQSSALGTLVLAETVWQGYAEINSGTVWHWLVPDSIYGWTITMVSTFHHYLKLIYFHNSLTYSWRCSSGRLWNPFVQSWCSPRRFVCLACLLAVFQHFIVSCLDRDNSMSVIKQWRSWSF